MEFAVDEHEAGRRLDEILAGRAPGFSRMLLRRILDAGDVTVDGETQPAGRRLDAGRLVRVALPDDAVSAMTPEPMALRILAETPDWVAVDKPPGVMVHPAGRHRSGTLLNGLAYRYNVELGRQPPVRPGVVHRLDRSTSGVILFALHQRALSRLTIEFQQRRVEKRYLALVRGVVEADEGVWDAPIGFDRERFPRWGISSEGRPGVSRFHVLRRLSSHTLLELEPVTGRTNQLRIHAAHFGHPLVGDALFAPAEEEQEQRLFLHAASLRFTDPLTGTAVFLQSPVPEELQAGLQAVERAGAAGEHGSPAAASARPPATLV